MNATTSPTGTPGYSLWQLMLYFLRLGTLGFGGPVALVGFMHRDLVEERKWITESDYKEGLALAQIAPGPLAAQLAIYLGFVHHCILGAIACSEPPSSGLPCIRCFTRSTPTNRQTTRRTP